MRIRIKGKFTLPELLVSLQRAVDAIQQRPDIETVAYVDLYFTPFDAEGEQIKGRQPRPKPGEKPRHERVTIEIEGYNGPTAESSDQ